MLAAWAHNATHYAHEVHAVKNWKPVFNYPASPSLKNFNFMGQAQGQISDNCKTSRFCIEILLAIWGHLKPYRLQSPSEDSRLLCIIFALFASNRRLHSPPGLLAMRHACHAQQPVVSLINWALHWVRQYIMRTACMDRGEGRIG